METYCVMMVTVPDQATGIRMAQDLVTTRLAACVSRIANVQSIYQWQGKVEESNEELLLIKTRVELSEAVTQRVKAMHPYQVPEVIVVPIQAGWPAYLQWIHDETRIEE